MKLIHKQDGMTFVEVLAVLVLFGFITIIASRVVIMGLQTSRRGNEMTEMHTKARIAMNQFVKDYRASNTVSGTGTSGDPYVLHYGISKNGQNQTYTVAYYVSASNQLMRTITLASDTDNNLSTAPVTGTPVTAVVTNYVQSLVVTSTASLGISQITITVHKPGMNPFDLTTRVKRMAS
ncbi:MAG: PilW family protein [Chitinophagales bacterium]